MKQVTRFDVIESALKLAMMFMVAVVLCVAFQSIDTAYANIEPACSGVVMSKIGDDDSCGDGIFDGKKTVEIVHNWHESQRFLLLVEIDDRAFIENVSAVTYASVVVGSRVRVGVARGIFRNYGYRVMGLEDSE